MSKLSSKAGIMVGLRPEPSKLLFGVKNSNWLSPLLVTVSILFSNPRDTNPPSPMETLPMADLIVVVSASSLTTARRLAKALSFS